MRGAAPAVTTNGLTLRPLIRRTSAFSPPPSIYSAQTPSHIAPTIGAPTRPPSPHAPSLAYLSGAVQWCRGVLRLAYYPLAYVTLLYLLLQQVEPASFVACARIVGTAEPVLRQELCSIDNGDGAPPVPCLVRVRHEPLLLLEPASSSGDAYPGTTALVGTIRVPREYAEDHSTAVLRLLCPGATPFIVALGTVPFERGVASSVVIDLAAGATTALGWLGTGTPPWLDVPVAPPVNYSREILPILGRPARSDCAVLGGALAPLVTAGGILILVIISTSKRGDDAPRGARRSAEESGPLTGSEGCCPRVAALLTFLYEWCAPPDTYDTPGAKVRIWLSSGWFMTVPGDRGLVLLLAWVVHLLLIILPTAWIDATVENSDHVGLLLGTLTFARTAMLVTALCDAVLSVRLAFSGARWSSTCTRAGTNALLLLLLVRATGASPCDMGCAGGDDTISRAFISLMASIMLVAMHAWCPGLLRLPSMAAVAGGVLPGAIHAIERAKGGSTAEAGIWEPLFSSRMFPAMMVLRIDSLAMVLMGGVLLGSVWSLRTLAGNIRERLQA